MALATADAAALVERLYAAVLGRAPDGFEDLLVPYLVAGADPDGVRAGLAFSAEAAGLVQGIYQAQIGRAADPAGLAQFQTALAHGLGLDDIRAAIVGSPEAAASRAARAVYAQALGRAPDAAGLNLYAGAVANGLALAGMRAQLASSPEAQAALVRAHAAVFGIAPAPATLAALTGELALGRPLADVEQVVDHQTRTSGFFTDHDGYAIPAAYAANGADGFVTVATIGYDFYQGTVTTLPVPLSGPSELAPGLDTIRVDLSSIGAAPVGFVASLDDAAAGGGSVATMPQTVVSGPSTRDEFTFSGAFGPGLHHLELAVVGSGTIGIDGGSFDGMPFLLGGGNTGASGTLDIYPNPGPRPAITVVSTFP